MTEMISKDHAETAIQLALNFEARMSMEGKEEWEVFNEAATSSGTAFAMIEIAPIVDDIFEQIPNRDALGKDVFNGFILDEFNFPEDGSTPTLKRSAEDVIAFFVDEFELDKFAVASGM